MARTDVVDILLLDLPVALWAATAARSEALVEALRAQPCEGPPAKLLAVVDRLGGDFAEVSAPSELELRAAAARRAKEIDVAYGVPRGARDDLAALAKAFDAAEKHLRKHGRADLVATPEEAAFRRWFIDQVVAQIDGAFPTPWQG